MKNYNWDDFRQSINVHKNDPGIFLIQIMNIECLVYPLVINNLYREMFDHFEKVSPSLTNTDLVTLFDEFK